MTTKLEVYTGFLTYRNIEFNFIFDGKELRLITPKDKINEVNMWFYTSLVKGVNTTRDPLYIEEILIGNCNETGQKIIFLPKKSYSSLSNDILKVNIDAYIIEKYAQEWIDRIGFTSKEIDCIFPTTQALQEFESGKDGIVSIKTKGFSETTSPKQTFFVDDKEIKVNFSVSLNGSWKIGQPPLELHSVMFFEFDKTSDYYFILRLFQIAKSFIQYLCYRKNIDLYTAKLSSPCENEMHSEFATLYIVSNYVYDESEVLEKGYYIKQECIKGVEGKILDDISSDKIYLRHIPESYKSGHIIDASRFVMITAAFEWTFNKNYPDGIKKEEKTIEAEDKIITEITKLKDESTGKQRKIYNFLLNLVKFNSLQSKIIQTSKDYEEIIDVFGKYLYKINNEELNYNDMGERISEQRNNYAHGNLDKDFIGLSILDLIYLQYIVYAMQLKEYGVDDISIKRAINDLFGHNLSL